MSVEEIDRRLEDRFALLRGGDRSAPDRHRALLTVIEWSWNLLDPAGQRALRRLALFHDGFTLAAAEAVLGADAVDAVRGLVDQSLLTVGETPGRGALPDAGDGTRVRSAAARPGRPGGRGARRPAPLGRRLCERPAAPDHRRDPVRGGRRPRRRGDQPGRRTARPRSPTATGAPSFSCWPCSACSGRSAASTFACWCWPRRSPRRCATGSRRRSLADATRAAVAITLNNTLMTGGASDGPLLTCSVGLAPARAATRRWPGPSGCCSRPIPPTSRRRSNALNDSPPTLTVTWPSPPVSGSATCARTPAIRRARSRPPQGALALADDEDGPWARAMAHNQLAELAMHLGDRVAAVEHARAALPVMRRLGAADDEIQLRALLVLSAIADGRLADAADELDRVERIDQGTVDLRRPRLPADLPGRAAARGRRRAGPGLPSTASARRGCARSSSPASSRTGQRTVGYLR